MSSSLIFQSRKNVRDLPSLGDRILQKRISSILDSQNPDVGEVDTVLNRFRGLPPMAPSSKTRTLFVRSMVEEETQHPPDHTAETILKMMQTISRANSPK